MTDQRACCVCHRQALEPTERQTCVGCLACTRNALAETVELYALLPGELTGHVGAARPPDAIGRPDSDGLPEAMVMLAGGTAGTVIGTKPTATDPTGRAHAADVWPSDPPSVLASLAFWEDDWRSVAGLAAAQAEATVAGCSAFLLGRLSWAAQQHPAFDEFAADMRDLRYRLQCTLRTNPQRSPVKCIRCEKRALERPMPRDGRTFEWQCSACHQNYTQEEYWMAVRQQGEQESEVA